MGESGDTPGYLKPYEDAVRAVGPRFESLLWRNADMQRTRLEVLTELAQPAGRIVCDLGCGRADLLALWNETGVDYKGYVGVEGVDELRAASADRAESAGWRDATFVLADFVADEELFERLVRKAGVDTVMCSGSLNTLPQTEAEGVLGRAWAALSGRPGGRLAFNFLSDRGAAKRKRGENLGPATRYDTHRLLGWALDRSPLVHFRQDYLAGHDASIVLTVEGTRQ